MDQSIVLDDQSFFKKRMVIITTNMIKQIILIKLNK